MMDSRLSFDVYVEIADPCCRVEHDVHDRRVSVVIGGWAEMSPLNMLQLWFKEPGTITKLGSELISAGMRLDAQLADARAKAEAANKAGVTNE